MMLNALMTSALARRPSRSWREDDELVRLARLGWVVGVGNALLLAGLSGTSRRAVPIAGVGQLEYDANEVYLPLARYGDERAACVSDAAGVCVEFARHVLAQAKGLPGVETLSAIVSVWADATDDDFWDQAAHVHFFTRREGYPVWVDQVDRFMLEAVAVLGPI